MANMQRSTTSDLQEIAIVRNGGQVRRASGRHIPLEQASVHVRCRGQHDLHRANMLDSLVRRSRRGSTLSLAAGTERVMACSAMWSEALFGSSQGMQELGIDVERVDSLGLAPSASKSTVGCRWQ